MDIPLNTESTGCITRRTALAGIVGGMATLAGCSGGENNTADENNTNTGDGANGGDAEKTTNKDPTANVIDDVSIETDTVAVSITNPDKADTLQVLNPEGSMAETKEIPDTVSKINIPIGPGTYVPGEFAFLAVTSQNGSTVEVDSTTKEISPQIEIERVATTGEVSEQTLDEYEGDDELFEAGSIYAWVTNTGSGPTALTGIGAGGDIPGPVEADGFEKGSEKEFLLYPGDEKMVGTPGDDVLRSNFNEYYPSEGSVSVTVASTVGPDLIQVHQITFPENHLDAVTIGPAVQEIRE